MKALGSDGPPSATEHATLAHSVDSKLQGFLAHRSLSRSDETEIRAVKEPAEKVVKDIRRMTRRKFSAEEKIRIVLAR